jgi:membrane associated rhomboid family serine protease
MRKEREVLMRGVRFALQFLAVIWAVHLFQVFTTADLAHWGIYPRKVFGLKGVILAPLVHSDWQHLISNSVPFLFLTVMIMYFYRSVAYRSFLMIYFLTGLAVWIFGRSVFHIGASGVVYGLVSFVFWSGVFRRSLQSIVLALIVTFLYSGFIVGILPNQEGISWESHLLGGIIGIFASYWYKEEIEQHEQPEEPEWMREEDPTQRPFFLDRDTFEKTRAEREAEARRLREEGDSWFSNSTWNS